MLRKWVKILPYIVVEKLAMWFNEEYVVKSKYDGNFYAYIVDSGEAIIISKERRNKIDNKFEQRRKKKIEKLKIKKYKIEQKLKEVKGDVDE